MHEAFSIVSRYNLTSDLHLDLLSNVNTVVSITLPILPKTFSNVLLPQVDEKAAQLKKSFPRDRGQGRLRTSSTGSIHICYSDSNTSMEDVSKNF